MSDTNHILSKLQAEESKGKLSPELVQLSGEFRTLLADFGGRIQEITIKGVLPDYELMDAQQARLHELADQISALLKKPLEEALEQLPPELNVVASFRNSMHSQMVRKGKKRVLNPSRVTDNTEPKFITIDAQVGLLSPVTNDQGVEIPDTYQYTDIEGNTWPISLKQVVSVLAQSLASPEKQLWLERGFYELVFDPTLAPIDTQADNLADHYLTRAQAGTLYRPDADGHPGEVIQHTDATPVPAKDEYQMTYLTDELHTNQMDNENGGDSIDYSKLLYGQHEYQGTTKHDLIQEARSQQEGKQQGVIPGWRVYLVHKPTLVKLPPTMSQEQLIAYQSDLTKGTYAPLPSGKSPLWYTEQLERMGQMQDTAGTFLYPGLTGMHVDLALSLASQVAQRDGLVMDDMDGFGKANLLTGNIFKWQGFLPSVYWFQSDRQFHVKSHSIGSANSFYGFRPAVRVC